VLVVPGAGILGGIAVAVAVAAIGPRS
jgi:hypothetical protein